MASQAGVEQCDDGNSVQSDNCLNNCTSARCGDGVIQVGVETCDDSNRVNTDACNQCQLARCGDGIIRENFEECDDGNTLDTDTCTSQCLELTAVMVWCRQGLSVMMPTSIIPTVV